MDQQDTDRPPQEPSASHAAFTASSAHRRLRPARPLATKVLLWGGVTLAAMILFFQLRSGGSPPPSPLPTATARPQPRATVTPTPTPEAVESTGDWVEVAPEPTMRATATATPWPTLPPRVRRQPTPTPPVEQCVEASWDAVQNRYPLNRIRVSIQATNHCGRELGPNELWFEVSGWRQGALVQSVDGHIMEELWPGGSEEVVIGLPGSLDWYDQIRVIVHGPGH